MKRAYAAFRNAGAAVVGFAAAASLLSATIPPLRVAHLSVKLDWLAAHPAEFDVLVVGSSRMRQVVPAVFDSQLAASGFKVRTFNLSADGMRPPEDAYVLERALRQRAAPLKFLILEANPIAIRMEEEDEDRDRMMHWHDTRRIAAIWRRAFSHSIEDPPWIGKWISDTWRNVRFASRHTRLWILNSVRLGHGSRLIHGWLGISERPKFARGLGERRDGYIPPANDRPMAADGLESYRAALEKKLRMGADLDPMDAASQEQIARAARLAARHGAALVVVGPPTTTVKTFAPRFPSGTQGYFIDLSDPVKHPELFEAEVRRDGSHLTAEGSILFTRTLAAELAERIASEKRK